MQDREKWNTKYGRPDAAPTAPSILLTGLDQIVPCRGRALDVAGGAGRHAIWLARRGLDVTLADISDVGLEIARRRSRLAGTTIDTRQIDFPVDSFPPGPWDLIVSFHYLWRPLFDVFPNVLAPGGTLVFAQPTRSNLQRHEKPPEGYLLEDGELSTLVKRLHIIRLEEGWLAEGRHDALLIASRIPSGSGKNTDTST
jgi:SAM-dependent methyltransferase